MEPSLVAINIAYLLYVAATIPKSIVPLRVVLIVASVAFILYGIIDDNRSVIAWNALFGAAQLFQLVRELRDRRAIALTPEEESIRSERFPTMRPRDFLVFWSIGEDRKLPGEELMRQGEAHNVIALLTRGTASVFVNDQHVAERGPGTLLGEVSLITGEPASATVRLSDDAEVRLWDHDKVHALTRAQPEASAALLATFARELSIKVSRAAS